MSISQILVFVEPFVELRVCPIVQIMSQTVARYAWCDVDEKGVGEVL